MLTICSKYSHAQLNLNQRADNYLIYGQINLGTCQGTLEFEFPHWATLKGQIKSVDEFCYSSTIPGKEANYPIDKEEWCHYNEQGYLTSLAVQELNVIPTIVRYSYDKTYNTDGLISELDENTANKTDKSLNKILFKYDNEKKIIEEDSYHVDNRYDIKTTFSYDDKNRLTRLFFSQINNTNPEFNTAWNYIYNKTGYSIIESIPSFHKKDKIIPEYKNWYYEIENNNIVEGGSFQKEKTHLISYRNTYDILHNLIKYESFSGGRPDTYTIYKYLKLDSRGNWIQRKEYQVLGEHPHQEVPMALTIRKIEYYN